MNILVMMYVVFDKNGDIKSIGPTLPSEVEHYTTATFPLREVEEFLTGKKNPFDYYVKVTKNPITYKITRKAVSVVNYVRTLDHFLTEVPRLPKSSNASILIEAFIEDRKIKVSIGPSLRIMCDDPETDEQEEIVNTFKSTPNIQLFFTNKGDPYHLLYTYNVLPKMLLNDGEMLEDCNVDLSNSSVYTKKIIDGYSYVIRK